MIKERLELRHAGLQDIHALADVAGKIFEDSYKGKMPGEDLQAYIASAFSADQLRAEWGDKRNLFILAVYDGQLAGYAKITIGASPEPDSVQNPMTDPALDVAQVRHLAIDRMYVLREYQSMKIGASLMRYCLHYAESHYFDIVWLAVWEQNPLAVQFYRRWGFEIFGSRFFMRGKDRQTGLLMKKQLK